MNELHTALNLFNDTFGKKTGIILLLSTVYAALCTLFAELGVHQDHILALVGDSPCIFTRVCDLLKIFKSTTGVSAGADRKRLTDHFHRVKDDFSFFPFAPNSEAIDNKLFLNGSLPGCRDTENRFLSLVTVYFSAAIPPEISGNFLAAGIELCEDSHSKVPLLAAWRKDFIALCKEHVPSILETIRKFHESDRSQVPCAWLYAAAEVLVSLYGDCTTDGELYAAIRKEIGSALECSILLQDNDCVSELVRRCLYDYAGKGLLPMAHIDNLAEQSVTDLDSMPLCDSDYYYFSDILFREICKPLFDSVTYGQINEALNRDGIQVSQGIKRVFNTSKVPFVNVYGATVQKRFHKLNREKTDLPGDGDLETIFNAVFMQNRSCATVDYLGGDSDG